MGSLSMPSKLVAPKDKNNKLDKSDTIYDIKYHDCDQAYAWKIKRKLKLRLKEHGRESSPVEEHLQHSRQLSLLPG